MNEGYVRGECFSLLRRLWYTPHRLRDAILCPKCGTKVLPMVSGRSDIIANSAYGPGVYVEVKVLNLKASKSFPFSAITEEQREYFRRRTEEGFRCYLALGTVNVPKKGNAVGRQLWIVDWDEWLFTEGLIEPYQQSIPLIAGSGFKKELQEGELDLIHLLADYECNWEDGKWRLPEYHSLWQDYNESFPSIPIGEREL